MKRTLLIIAMLFLCASSARADDVRFELMLSGKTTCPGKQVLLDVAFPGVLDMPLVNMPPVEGLEFRYRKSTVRDTGGSDGIVHTFGVVPLKEGIYKIGPLTFPYDGNTFVSNSVVLQVSEDLDPGRRKAAKTGDSISDHIFLEVKVPDSPIYVNEIVPVTAEFYTDWLDVEDLNVVEKPNEGVIAGKFESEGTKIVPICDARFACLTFKKTIFVPAPGEYDFGPVTASGRVVRARAAPLNNNAAFYESYLGNKEYREISVEKGPFALKVLPLPPEGKPSIFAGAVGRFDMELKYLEKEIVPGGTLDLKVEITGTGNMNTVSAPVTEKVKGLKYFPPLSEKIDGGRSFLFRVRVDSPAIKEIPPFKFAYFDPLESKYHVLTEGPANILMIVSGEKDKERAHQEEGSKTAPDTSDEKKEDLLGIKEQPGKGLVTVRFLMDDKVFFTVMVLPVLILGMVIYVKRKLDVFDADKSYLLWLEASRRARDDISRASSLLRSGKADKFYEHVFRSLQLYLGIRLDMRPEGITEHNVRDLLKDVAVSDSLYELFNDCYLARYTGQEPDIEDMRRTYKSFREVIRSLNDIKNFTPSHRPPGSV